MAWLKSLIASLSQLQSLSFSKLNSKNKMAEAKMKGEDFHGLGSHCHWH
jgi:hypothetical protein